MPTIPTLSRSEAGRWEVESRLDYIVRIYHKNEGGSSAKNTFLLEQRTQVQFLEPMSASETLMSSSGLCRHTGARARARTHTNDYEISWITEPHPHPAERRNAPISSDVATGESLIQWWVAAYPCSHVWLSLTKWITMGKEKEMKVRRRLGRRKGGLVGVGGGKSMPKMYCIHA